MIRMITKLLVYAAGTIWLTSCSIIVKEYHKTNYEEYARSICQEVWGATPPHQERPAMTDTLSHYPVVMLQEEHQLFFKRTKRINLLAVLFSGYNDNFTTYGSLDYFRLLVNDERGAQTLSSVALPLRGQSWIFHSEPCRVVIGARVIKPDGTTHLIDTTPLSKADSLYGVTYTYADSIPLPKLSRGDVVDYFVHRDGFHYDPGFSESVALSGPYPIVHYRLDATYSPVLETRIHTVGFPESELSLSKSKRHLTIERHHITDTVSAHRPRLNMTVRNQARCSLFGIRNVQNGVTINPSYSEYISLPTLDRLPNHLLYDICRTSEYRKIRDSHLSQSDKARELAQLCQDLADIGLLKSYQLPYAIKTLYDEEHIGYDIAFTSRADGIDLEQLTDNNDVFWFYHIRDTGQNIFLGSGKHVEECPKRLRGKQAMLSDFHTTFILQ